MLIIEPTESSTSEFDDVVLRAFGVGGLYKVLLKMELEYFSILILS